MKKYTAISRECCEIAAFFYALPGGASLSPAVRKLCQTGGTEPPQSRGLRTGDCSPEGEPGFHVCE